jgi:hypothetical protein
MHDNISQEIELTRRNRGNLAEALLNGLNDHLPDFLQEYISDCTENQYAEYVGKRPVRVSESDLNPYNWMESEEIDIESNMSWRPDLIAKASWSITMNDPNLEIIKERLDDSDAEASPLVDGGEYYLLFRVHYPIEIKSGDKITLTEQQATVIPRIVKECDYIHPLLAEVDISNLPREYEVNVQTFSDFSFDGGRYRTQ